MARYKSRIPQRWPFRHKFKNGTERVYWFKAIPATSYARPILEAAHVQESIDRDGVADTQNCTEAVCAQRNPDAFDHPVEGTVDFTYSRAAVVTKVYKEPRRLSRNSTKIVSGECVVYEHSHGDIAKLNDTRRGQQKLLQMLKENGPLQQTFRPLRIQSKRTWASPPGGKRTGSRTRHSLRGSKARAAFATAAFELPTK